MMKKFFDAIWCYEVTIQVNKNPAYKRLTENDISMA